MKLEDLSPELQEKIESCETVEELTNPVMSDAHSRLELSNYRLRAIGFSPYSNGVSTCPTLRQQSSAPASQSMKAKLIAIRSDGLS